MYTRPVKGEVLRPFSVEALTLDPTLGDWRTHGGVDLAAAIGTEVLAMGPGTVAEIKQDGLMGTTVVVDQGDGLRTTYANLAAKPTVKEGDTVRTRGYSGRGGGHRHRRERPGPPPPSGDPHGRPAHGPGQLFGPGMNTRADGRS